MIYTGLDIRTKAWTMVINTMEDSDLLMDNYKMSQLAETGYVFSKRSLHCQT